MFMIMITLWFICRKREYTFSYSSIGTTALHTSYTVHTHSSMHQRTNELHRFFFNIWTIFSFLVESSWVKCNLSGKTRKSKAKENERLLRVYVQACILHMLSSECVSFYQYVRCLINWIPIIAFEISICIAHTSHTRLNYYRNKIRFLVNFLKALRHATFVCNDSTSLKVIIYCSMYVFWLQTCNQVNCSMHRNLWIEWEFLVFLLSHVLLSSAYQNHMVQLPTMMWDTLITKNS